MIMRGTEDRLRALLHCTLRLYQETDKGLLCVGAAPKLSGGVADGKTRNKIIVFAIQQANHPSGMQKRAL